MSGCVYVEEEAAEKERLRLEEEARLEAEVNGGRLVADKRK